MAFTAEEFPDLVRLVEAHPEWRAELRRLVLTDELLAFRLAQQHQVWQLTAGHVIPPESAVPSS